MVLRPHLLTVLVLGSVVQAQEKQSQPSTPGGLWRAHDRQRSTSPVVAPPPHRPAPVRKARAAEQRVKIRTMTAQMRYDLETFTVQPGALVRLEFENADDLPHNLVFCRPGTDTAAMSLKQMENPAEALKRNWLPDDPSIWLHSSMLNPHQSEVLRFTAPSKPGSYPYVCTFPGHALTMRGVMRVLPLGGGLKDLRYALYLGAWRKLPDFSQLKPHREGRLEDNLVQLKLDDYRNEFGVVYTGQLQAPRTGSYRFYLAGDDGVRLRIDGNTVIEHDGIHPAEIREGSVNLEAGAHVFQLEYFQAQGRAEVFVAWKGPNFAITPLSSWLPKDWEKGGVNSKRPTFEPIPLTVGEEPVIYRNFIAGAGNRGLGIGYPGGFNLAWDADQMNLAVLWRGAFIDASRHWNGRGGGHQSPLGYDAVQPAPGVPLARLATPDSAWPDSAEGYVWRGYRLDERRHPVLAYSWNGLLIREHYETQGQGTQPTGRLLRVLEFDAKPPAGTMLRVAVGRLEAAEDGRFLVEASKEQVPERQFENRLWIRVSGARVRGNELLLPVAGRRITIEYSWTN
jgi:plastocyanin